MAGYSSKWVIQGDGSRPAPVEDKTGDLSVGLQVAGLAAVLGISLVLRAIRLGSRDFWHDEVAALLQSESLGEMLITGDYVSFHPPLFEALLALWRWVGLGAGEWAIRFVPLILGVATVSAVFYLGKLLFDSRTGLVAAFLLAISPYHVLHSQYLSAYILVPLTGTLALYFLYWAGQTNQVRHWCFYGLFVALASYSGLYAAPLLLAANLWFVLTLRGRSDRFLPWIAANLGGALLFAPQLGIMLKKTGVELIQRDLWRMQLPALPNAGAYLKTIAFGYSNAEPYYAVALGIFFAFGAVGTVMALVRNERGAMLTLFWFVGPLTLVALLSFLLGQSLFVLPGLLPFAIPCYVLVGLGVTSLPHSAARWTGVLLFALVAALPLTEIYRDDYKAYASSNRSEIPGNVEWRNAAVFVKAAWRDGDTLITTGVSSWLSFYWYGLKGYPKFFAAEGKEFIENFEASNPSSVGAKEFDSYFPAEVETVVRGKNRVWLVFDESEWTDPEGSASRVWRWMETHYSQVGRHAFDGLDVFLYQREESGVPIIAVERDADRGESAKVTYESERKWTYETAKPSTSVARRTGEPSRGNLTLAFAESNRGPVKSVAVGQETRQVSFSLSNHGPHPATAYIECIESDVLVDVASFEDPRPEDDVWHVARTHNPRRPGAVFNLPVAEARHRGGMGEYSIRGKVILEGGAYTGRVRLLRSSGNPALRRIRLRLMMGNEDLLGLVPKADMRTRGWHWFATPEIYAPQNGSAVVLEAVAEGLGDGELCPASIGYVSFLRRRSNFGKTLGETSLAVWPGRVEIYPDESRAWTLELDSDVARVDVWAFEEGGEGYRIFRIFEGRSRNDD